MWDLAEDQNSVRLLDDMSPRTLVKLPEHPGLGRARPQGPVGLQVPQSPAR
jgi:membrane fusion protein (multidrug efflux system)